MRRVIITEEQEKRLIEILNNEEVQQMPVPEKSNKPYTIDTDKVKTVRRFLDKNFKPDFLEWIGTSGLPEKVRVAAVYSSAGEPLKNYYEEDLIDLLIEKYKKMFLDKEERSLFMKQVVKDWFDNKIGVHGTLSVNCLK